MMIVDENGFQAMGATRDVLDLGSIQKKFESFGFLTLTIDGHDEDLIDQTIRALWDDPSDQPRALIAKTVKGKGVPFMEHNNIWHYTRLNSETYVQAVTAVMKADQ